MICRLSRVLVRACLHPAGGSKPLGLIFLLERALGGANQGTRAGVKKMRSVDMDVCYSSVCGCGGRVQDLLLMRGPFITRSTFGLLVIGVPGATLRPTCRVVSV